MQSNFTKKLDVQGTWKDTTCNSPAYYLCEMNPVWGLDDIITVLIETRKSLNETRSTLEDANRKLEEIITNPVPIGFIYTQFPQQPIPSSLWPSVTWTEVTSEFAGKFFRAAGGNAGEFGETQEADSPRLSQVSVSPVDSNERNVNVTAGRWSDLLYSSTWSGAGTPYSNRFFVTDAEVRPINTAIRIWKRVS